MDRNSEDLLTFKEFSSTSTNNPPAQINVNSPEKNITSRSRDPLQALSYDMSIRTFKSDNDEKQYSKGISDASLDDNCSSKTVSFLTMEYYQQFFNVDTSVVLDRICIAMVPKRAPSNYLIHHIGCNPDLYGPFWIIVTLIFSIGISGNIAIYLQTANDDHRWTYNFHLVSYAASCICFYSCLFPGALWALIKYSVKPFSESFETEDVRSPSLLSLICVYGYSLAIYVPVSILWVIQVSILQWLLVFAAALASGSVLISVLAPALKNSKISHFLMIGIFGAHLLLASGFMLYFFHVPNISPTTETKILQELTVSTVTNLNK